MGSLGNRDELRTVTGYPAPVQSSHSHPHSGEYPPQHQPYPPQHPHSGEYPPQHQPYSHSGEYPPQTQCAPNHPHSGYPPQLHQPYQPYPPQQPYYPPQPYPNYPNPYAAPPPATYYGHPPHHLPAKHEFEHTSGLAVTRAIFLIMAILLFGALLMGLVTYVILGTGIPVFDVESFVVPTFHINNSGLEATFEANWTAKNTNTKLDLFFYHIEAFVFHQEHLMAVTLVEPMNLPKRESGIISAVLSANRTDGQQGVNDHVVKEIENHRSEGRVTFNLRMMIEASYASSGSMLNKRLRLRVFCDDLTVDFPSSTGGGTLIHSDIKECLVHI